MRPLAVLLLLVSNAVAGWPDARIVLLADGGSGSFVSVGGKVAILSCAHRDATTSVSVGYRVGYRCGDDSTGNATVVAVYPHDPSSRPFRDAAVYSIDRDPPVGVRPFVLTNKATPPQTRVWVVGFPSWQFRSRVTRTLPYDGTLWLEGASTPGESGGPIVNEDGDIVGTLTGYTSDGKTLGCPVNVLCDLLHEVELAWCPNGRCPNGPCPQPQWQPVQSQPVQSTPAPVPQPPKPDSQLVEIKQNITNINQSITTLQNQIKQVSGCDCSKACGDVEARLNAKIETLAAAHTELKQQIATIQNNSSATPNYDAIADEMAKRLKHSATVTLLDGTKQTQTRPLSDPLEFNQHVRPKQ